MNIQPSNVARFDRSAQRFFFSNLRPPESVVDLAAGQGWAVRGRRRQQTLFCLQGNVWVTQECDIRDYVLEAGDAFLITQPGLVMVRALKPARIGYAENLGPAPFNGPFGQTVFN